MGLLPFLQCIQLFGIDFGSHNDDHLYTCLMYPTYSLAQHDFVFFFGYLLSSAVTRAGILILLLLVARPLGVCALIGRGVFGRTETRGMRRASLLCCAAARGGSCVGWHLRSRSMRIFYCVWFGGVGGCCCVCASVVAQLSAFLSVFTFLLALAGWLLEPRRCLDDGNNRRAVRCSETVKLEFRV